MAIIQASSKKQYAIEAQLKLRALASGLKLTDAVLLKMGLKAGIAQVKEDGKVTVEGEPGDQINYGVDSTTGDLFIFKAEDGAVIGANKTFTSNGLKAKLLEMASGHDIKGASGKISVNTELKGGLQIRFDVAETPTVENGISYFKVTFSEAVVVEKDEDDAKSETKEVATKDAVKSDW